MKDIQQLIKKNSQEGRYEDIFPKTFIDAVLDKESGVTLTDILAMFNMLFLSYDGNKSQTRLQVPSSLRREGLWVTYVLYDKTVVTEWYSAEAIDDTTFGDSANWRDGSNALVGDISISSDGYWVINGEVTNIKAQGEAGITPILRVGSNNHLQVSYTNGSSYVDVSSNPVFTQFRVSNNKLEQSVDLGLTWTVASDYIAAWFRFTGTTGSSQADNVGKIQISRDNGATWSDLSGEFTNSLHIKGYVATVGTLPSTAVQGDIYGVGPTYDPSDTEYTNPIYQLYVKDSTGWVNNGRFTSIAAGVVQTTGTSTTEVMSQDAVTRELTDLKLGVIYDVSAHNNDAVFESLSALLNNADLNTLIPISVRCGGMNIRFVQTVLNSDNKYVQYRLIADEWSTDTEDWVIADEGVYIENYDFVYVKTDVAGKIFWGIKVDGTFYFGAGIPPQIQDYIKKLLNEKVDKEEGKSLIDEEYAEGVHYIENSEFAEVKFDHDGRILEGIKNDGTKIIGSNLKVLGSLDINGISYSVVSNSEWLKAVIDSENKIICGIKTDGTFCIVDIDFLDPSNNIKDVLNYFDVIDNPKFLSIELDENNKVLSYRKEDGTLVDNNEVENPTIKRIQNEVSSVVSRVFSNPSSIVSFLEYNQIKEDKCNNNVRYLLFQENASPFDNNKFIKNGKIYQTIGNREYKAKIAIFGDTHFGYTLDGSLVLDPTTEDRCGMAFTKSNQKNADFSIIVGDVLQGGTLEQVLGSYDIYYDKLKLLNSPCFPIQGNHDELIIHRGLLGLDELTKFGIIEFNGVRIICFKATQVWPTSSTKYDAGDIPDNIFALIKKAIIDSYNEGFITILACHYEFAYYPDIPEWACSIRKHRDDLIDLCQQYNVRLFLHGHEHTSGLLHKIVKNDEVTLDMTDVLFGWTHVSYSIMEVTDNGFNIVEYDTMTDNVLHTLFIPMVDQENGTIYI